MRYVRIYRLQWVNVHTCMNSISTLGTYVNAYLNHHESYNSNKHVSTLDETNSRTHYSTMWLYDRVNSGSHSDWGKLYHSQDSISMLVHQLPSFPQQCEYIAYSSIVPICTVRIHSLLRLSEMYNLFHSYDAFESNTLVWHGREMYVYVGDNES
jgi:hypothetical protein